MTVKGAVFAWFCDGLNHGVEVEIFLLLAMYLHQYTSDVAAAQNMSVANATGLENLRGTRPIFTSSQYECREASLAQSSPGNSAHSVRPQPIRVSRSATGQECRRALGPYSFLIQICVGVSTRRPTTEFSAPDPRVLPVSPRRSSSETSDRGVQASKVRTQMNIVHCL